MDGHEPRISAGHSMLCPYEEGPSAPLPSPVTQGEQGRWGTRKDKSRFLSPSRAREKPAGKAKTRDFARNDNRFLGRERDNAYRYGRFEI